MACLGPVDRGWGWGWGGGRGFRQGGHFLDNKSKNDLLLQRMGCFLKKAIFTMVLDMAYPRLILHHKVTLLIFRPFPHYLQ